MAVDRQKILNELGNVVNQLQSADCGCLGKVLSPGQGNPNPMSSAYPPGSCWQGGCGHNSPCAGEPCPGARRCMGFCNPPKLFAETYNYLKPNLMQPIVQEVYNDLKSINPQNTIMNNPKGAQMGLPAGGQNPGQGNPMAQNSMPGAHMGNENGAPQHMHGHQNHMVAPHFHFANTDHQGMDQSGQGFGQMGQGMGQTGQEMGQMGQTGQVMGGMEQGMGQRGHQMGHMNHGMDHMSYGMGHMGHGMNQMGQGANQMGHMGHEMRHTDHRMEHTGYGMGQGGQEMAQAGQGGQMGQMDQGMVHGMGQMGQMEQGMNQGMGQSIVQDMGRGRNHQMHHGGIAGMGPEILNMMHSSSKPNYQQNQGRSPNANAMPQSPEVCQMQGDVNQGQYNSPHMQNAGYMQANNMPQGDSGMQGDQQFMTQPNMSPGAAGNTQGGMPGHMQQMNPGSQRIGNMNDYGIHKAGMAKFNEMFSGDMKGDLGFDPMAIAMQMNPANEKKSAINAMQKVMMGDARKHPALDHLASNTAKLNLGAGLQDTEPTRQRREQPEGMTGRAPMQNNQQVYNTQTGAPIMNQQMPPQQLSPQEQQWQQQSQDLPEQAQLERYQQQQMADPNSEAVVSRTLPTVYEGYPNVRPQGGDYTVQHLYREPIFPADTTRHLLQSHHFAKPQKFYDYNTLGQQVEVIPGKQYRSQTPDLPQTLSPEGNSGRYSNVKSTVSKTALIGNKPNGRTPSRTQLQHVYNQYKGSQSFTQQNIRPTYGGSYSAGHINVPHDRRHPNPPHQAHIERVSGDTEANNYVPTKMDPIMDEKMAKSPDYTPAFKNCRNGLQDQVYSSSPTSAKWSFHGTRNSNAHFSTGYRFNKMR